MADNQFIKTVSSRCPNRWRQSTSVILITVIIYFCTVVARADDDTDTPEPLENLDRNLVGDVLKKDLVDSLNVPVPSSKSVSNLRMHNGDMVTLLPLPPSTLLPSSRPPLNSGPEYPIVQVDKISAKTGSDESKKISVVLASKLRQYYQDLITREKLV